MFSTYSFRFKTFLLNVSFDSPEKFSLILHCVDILAHISAQVALPSLSYNVHFVMKLLAQACLA